MDASGKPPPPPLPAQTFMVSADRNLYALEADDFAATVFDGQSPRISRSDSGGNMRVLDELRKQIRSTT
jgi:hypothetical protein